MIEGSLDIMCIQETKLSNSTIEKEKETRLFFPPTPTTIGSTMELESVTTIKWRSPETIINKSVAT